MSLCIDLAFVRMNCRSIGLPPGRLNEQAKHWSLLLSAISLRTFLQKKKKNDVEEWRGKGAMISSFLPSLHF